MSLFGKEKDESQKPDGGNDNGGFGDTPEDKAQREIFIATFSMLAKLAGADGTVSKREVTLVERFMDEGLKLDGERKTFAIKVFNKARKSAATFEEYVEQYRELLKDKPKMYEWMLDILLRVSLADEVYSGPEAALLEKARDIFKVPPERYSELKSRYVKEDPAAKKSQSGKSEKEQSNKSDDGGNFAVLGCKPESDAAEIEEAYKQRSQEYDPTRIAALGLPQDFVDLAEERQAAIKKAYLSIMQAKAAK